MFKQSFSLFAILVIPLAMLTLTPTSAGAVNYHPVEIGTLGNVGFNVAEDVNNSGTAVGFSWLDDDPVEFHAFRYGSGTTEDLGAPGSNSHAKGINAVGTIVGHTRTPDGRFTFRRPPEGGPLQTIGPNVGFGDGGKAINDSGLIVGNGEGAFTTFLAEAFAITPDDQFHPLGTFGGGVSSAKDVSNSGVIVGWSWGSDADIPRAFRHEGLGPLNPAPYSEGGDDIGNLGGTFAEAHAINEAGAIVGRSKLGDLDDSEIHPFLWTSSDGMMDLGTLGGAHGWAWDINEMGQVVGWSTLEPGNLGFSPKHAFLWDAENGLQDLNDLITPTAGLIVDAAFGINDNGWIVGSAIRQSDGLQVPVLLTPVPEPASATLLAGVVLLVLLRRRK